MLFALHYIHKWKLHCVSIWREGDGMGRETKSLSLSRFLMMLYHSAKRLTHLACHLNTESDLSTYWTCPLLKPEWKRAACYSSNCVFESFWTCEMAVNVCDLTFLPYPWTSILWPSWSGEHILHTHMCCGVGRGGCSLLKSPNFHCHGSFGSCTVELTCMAILWRAEPRWGQPRGLYVSNLWEQHAPNDVAEESMLKTHGLFRRFKWTGHCAT